MPKAIKVLTDPAFTRAAKKLLSAEDIVEFKSYIRLHPMVGDVIAGTGGFRKVRWAVGGKGRRGGVRIIYFFITNTGQIILFEVYAKSAKDNLTQAEKIELKKIAATIKRAATSKL